jgi:formyltetrahydrofolate-dependent phosphoribosylglycinamide formyltransferase
LKKRTVILISGRGSNMAALLAAAAAPAYPASVALVLSNRADAAGLARAAAAGVPTAVVESRAFRGDREAFERAVEAELERHGAELVALAGFMRVLTPGFVSAGKGRLVNIHPSLLPAFPASTPTRARWPAGVRLHGCTVPLGERRRGRGADPRPGRGAGAGRGHRRNPRGAGAGAGAPALPGGARLARFGPGAAGGRAGARRGRGRAALGAALANPLPPPLPVNKPPP